MNCQNKMPRMKKEYYVYKKNVKEIKAGKQQMKLLLWGGGGPPMLIIFIILEYCYKICQRG